MRGKTTLLLNGTHSASIHTRRSCCKKIDSVFCQLTTKEGNLISKINFIYFDTCTLKRPVAQLIMHLSTKQEVPGSNIDWLGNLLFTPMCVVKQKKTTLSTDNRKILLQPKEEVINHRKHSLYFGDES